MKPIFRFGAMLALTTLAGASQAQLIVNTLGNGTGYAIGNTLTGGGSFIGLDRGAGTAVPTDPATSGYAVLPFTVTSLATPSSVTSVSIALNLAPPTAGNSSFLNLLSGAIVQAPASNSLSLTGLADSDFFGFDTTPNQGGAVGDNTNRIYSAINPTSKTPIQQGNTYWLVLAPKRGLNANDTENLLNFGVALGRTSGQVGGANAGTLNTGFATTGQGLFGYNGARPGDTLSPLRGGGTVRPALYFGAAITVGQAQVPAPPAALVTLIGAVPGGLSLLRRRRNAK